MKKLKLLTIGFVMLGFTTLVFAKSNPRFWTFANVKANHGSLTNAQCKALYPEKPVKAVYKGDGEKITLKNGLSFTQIENVVGPKARADLSPEKVRISTFVVEHDLAGKKVETKSYFFASMNKKSPILWLVNEDCAAQVMMS